MKAELDLNTNKLQLDGDAKELVEFIGKIKLPALDAKSDMTGQSVTLISQSPVRDITEPVRQGISKPTTTTAKTKRILTIDNSELVALHKAGKTDIEIGEQYGISAKAVRARLDRLKHKEHNKKPATKKPKARKAKVPSAKIDRAAKDDLLIAYYEEGRLPAEMAQLLDISLSGVYQRLKKLDKGGKIKYVPKNPRLAKNRRSKTGSPWSKEDENKLKEMVGYSERLDRMAQYLHRPQTEVYEKLEELGLHAAS